jgi:hypothetical protein
MKRSDEPAGSEPEFITIVEGPGPEFSEHHDTWALSVLEGAVHIGLERCLVRTFNGGGLVERCRAAWHSNRPVLLDYPDRLGLRRRAEIVAARTQTVEEGDVLHLWVRQSPDEDVDAT